MRSQETLSIREAHDPTTYDEYFHCRLDLGGKGIDFKGAAMPYKMQQAADG
jgi:hypothetical protein